MALHTITVSASGTHTITAAQSGFVTDIYMGNLKGSEHAQATFVPFTSGPSSNLGLGSKLNEGAIVTNTMTGTLRVVIDG